MTHHPIPEERKQPVLTNSVALWGIFDLMNGEEWSADLLSAISDILANTETGRPSEPS